MKRLLLLLILVSIAIISCEKEENSESYRPIPNEGY
tara:strand:+ start:179 stop:286 length:108 start_codon:yes stop_codon:yes gene_type:complete